MEDQKAFLKNFNRKRLQYPRGVGSSINKEEKMRKPIMLLVMSIALAIGLVGCKPSVQEPQKVTLKVFMTFPRFQTQFEAYFEQFRVKYLEEKNIDVTIELEMPNSDQAAQILKARLSSNDAPDLFTLHAIADIPSFYEAGYLSDLSDQPFADDLLENVKDIVTYDGKVVALPLESLAWGYLYNKDIFADLGLTPPDTIAEMQNVVDVLKANDKTPFLLAFQESWIPQLMTALAIGGVVTSENPTFVDDMNAKTANYGDIAQIFDIIDIIMQNGTEKPLEVGNALASADFAAGKAAMWVQGTWQAQAILDINPNINIGCAPLPTSDSEDGALINLSVSTSLAVSPTSANKQVAMDLLNYILDPEDSTALFEELKFNPVATFHDYETYPWTDEAMSYVAQNRGYRDLSLPGAVTAEQASLLQAYYAGTVTKAEFIAQVDKVWKDSLND
jgi:raffinose/stachyose/melibiose transport system substrate-binding protein